MTEPTQSQSLKVQNREWTCRICSLNFQRYDHFKRHLNTHNTDKPYRWMHCDVTGSHAPRVYGLGGRCQSPFKAVKKNMHVTVVQNSKSPVMGDILASSVNFDRSNAHISVYMISKGWIKSPFPAPVENRIRNPTRQNFSIPAIKTGAGVIRNGTSAIRHFIPHGIYGLGLRGSSSRAKRVSRWTAHLSVRSAV
ncbi:hypothetical protein EYZ11_000760 [Aspergillus tanneri]|uniref:C2H2-type domain-containing protein n=1 Tax=Aspergillus tanneri TaxID=1220188 RepID=A0A4V3UQN0_9EURO|nr:hypothetical protein EYZ11_000760 [Aspergillus tanneri]